MTTRLVLEFDDPHDADAVRWAIKNPEFLVYLHARALGRAKINEGTAAEIWPELTKVAQDGLTQGFLEGAMSMMRHVREEGLFGDDPVDPAMGG